MALVATVGLLLLTGFDRLAELVPEIGPAAEPEHVAADGTQVLQQRGERAENLCYWQTDETIAPSCTDGWQHWRLEPWGVDRWQGTTREPPPKPTISAAVQAAANAPLGSVWDRLAQCESQGQWQIGTGNSYWGGIQINMANWVHYGGTAYAARPDLATRSQQIEIGQEILAEQGWRAWPACSRRLGLR